MQTSCSTASAQSLFRGCARGEGSRRPVRPVRASLEHEKAGIRGISRIARGETFVAVKTGLNGHTSDRVRDVCHDYRHGHLHEELRFRRPDGRIRSSGLCRHFRRIRRLRRPRRNLYGRVLLSVNTPIFCRSSKLYDVLPIGDKTKNAYIIADRHLQTVPSIGPTTGKRAAFADESADSTR